MRTQWSVSTGEGYLYTFLWLTGDERLSREKNALLSFYSDCDLLNSELVDVSNHVLKVWKVLYSEMEAM